MDYIMLITLATPEGTATQAGVLEITAAEIRYDLLDAALARTNPHAVSIAARSTDGLPTDEEITADVLASATALSA